MNRNFPDSSPGLLLVGSEITASLSGCWGPRLDSAAPLLIRPVRFFTTRSLTMRPRGENSVKRVVLHSRSRWVMIDYRRRRRRPRHLTRLLRRISGTRVIDRAGADLESSPDRRRRRGHQDRAVRRLRSARSPRRPALRNVLVFHGSGRRCGRKMNELHPPRRNGARAGRGAPLWGGAADRSWRLTVILRRLSSPRSGCSGASRTTAGHATQRSAS